MPASAWMTIVLTRWATMSCSSRAIRRRSSSAAASARASARPRRMRRTSWLRPTNQAPVNSNAGAVRSVIVASAVRAAPSPTAASAIPSPITARSPVA